MASPSAPLAASVVFHRTSLAFSALSPPHNAAVVSAALWHNRLLALGLHAPLFVVHDLGWALCLAPAERATSALFRQAPEKRVDAAPDPDYCALMRELVDGTQRIAEALAHNRADVQIALLAQLISPLCRAYARAGLPALPPASELPVSAAAYPSPAQYGDGAWSIAAGSATDPLATARAFARLVVNQRLALLTNLLLVDVGMLRFLGNPKSRSARAVAGSPPLSLTDPTWGMPDLMSVVQAEAPDVRDILRFSQDLLPALLEPQRSEDRQQYPIGGHASIERRGSIDSLLGSELVFDDTLFLHRLSDGEALYYGRERTPDRQLGPVQILVDASASMRGQRQVFARGLAWALARRLSSRREVSLRFFDGRLHEPQAFTAGPRPTGTSEAPLALLSFRSERGRNYQRVFSDLLRELRGQRQTRIRDARDPAGRPTLHIVTHGECHVPPRMMQDLAEHADLYAVFVMPSGPLQVDYLPWLAGYQVVDEALLDQRDERRRTALGIIDRAAEQKARA